MILCCSPLLLPTTPIHGRLLFFLNAVSAVPLLEGVDHLVLPQNIDEADHATSVEENEMPGQEWRPTSVAGGAAARD